MQEFTKAIQLNQTESINTDRLETIVDEFPYFQLAKTILLKNYYKQENYKYNNFLKSVAIHTVSRDVLFDYITYFEEIPKITSTSIKETSRKEVVADNFDFNTSEKHSFNQWLQLTSTTPINRKKTKDKRKTQKSNNKLSIINKFIQDNPKISPVKKPAQNNHNSLKNTDTNISNELMTETLAKVYLTQKKYDNAIQAYKILSLKYPEKSGLFADQIQRIKKLQNT